MRRFLLALAFPLLLCCRPPTERLVSAAYDGDREAVAAALREKGVDLNAQVEIKTDLYFRSLTAAASGGHVEIARMLLDAGADPNQGAGDETPLLKAVQWRHTDVVRLLLARGADPKLVDEDGNGPLLHLFKSSCAGDEKEITAIAEMLLEAGADPNTATRYGDQPFVRAINCGHMAVVRAFLAHGAKLDVRGRLSSGGSTETMTPLHAAVSTKQTDIMRVLLTAGASLTEKDHRGRTPCELAKDRGHGSGSPLAVLASAGDECAKRESDYQERVAAAQARNAANRITWPSSEPKEEPTPTGSQNETSTSERDPLQDASDRYRRATACPSGTKYCGSSCCGTGLMCCMPDGAGPDGNGMCIAYRVGHGCPWGSHQQ